MLYLYYTVFTRKKLYQTLSKVSQTFIRCIQLLWMPKSLLKIICERWQNAVA